MYHKEKFLSRMMTAVWAKDEYKECMNLLKTKFHLTIKGGNKTNELAPKIFEVEKLGPQIEEIRIFSEE